MRAGERGEEERGRQGGVRRKGGERGTEEGEREGVVEKKEGGGRGRGSESGFIPCPVLKQALPHQCGKSDKRPNNFPAPELAWRMYCHIFYCTLTSHSLSTKYF